MLWVLLSGCTAKLEPPLGQMILSAGLNTTIDSPLSLNQRTNRNWTAFHFSQDIPLTKYPPLHLLDDTHTNAALYLDVEPVWGWSSIQDLDIQDIVDQCESFNQHGRSVFLRFAPGIAVNVDMNTPWKSWGQQPNAFKFYWRKLVQALRSRPEANATVLVWSPFEVNLFDVGHRVSVDH